MDLWTPAHCTFFFLLHGTFLILPFSLFLSPLRPSFSPSFLLYRSIYSFNPLIPFSFSISVPLWKIIYNNNYIIIITTKWRWDYACFFLLVFCLVVMRFSQSSKLLHAYLLTYDIQPFIKIQIIQGLYEEITI